MSFLILFFCGMCVGFMGAFLGIGGGIVIIPLLTIVLNVPIHEAVATSLAIVVVNSIAASNKYLLSGAANLRLGVLLGLFSVSGAIGGSLISMNISSGKLYLILGSAQLVTAFFMVASRRGLLPLRKVRQENPDSVLTAEFYDSAAGSFVRYTPRPMLPVMGISALSGMLSGLVGVGGGVFIVPAITLIAGVPIKASTATSGFLMGFTAAAAGLLFFLSGYTNVYTVAAMVPGIFIATAIAARIFHKVDGDKVYKAFVMFLMIVAIQMLYRGVTGH